MTLKQLYYFQKLAQILNYTKAAQELYISQPSLSATIRDLEDELSASLFVKSGKGNQISLSPAGTIFLAHINNALSSIEEAQSAVSQYVASQKSRLHIGFIHTAHMSSMRKLFDEFLDTQNDSSLELKQDIFNVESEMLEQLRLQKLNFAFTLNLPSGINGFPIFYQDLYIIVSKSHPLAERNTISFDEIKHEPCVEVRHANTINQVIRDIFQQHRCEPVLSAYAGNLNVAVTYVLNSNCYTVAPKLSTMDFSHLTFLTIEGFPMVRPIYFSWKANRSLRQHEQDFLNFAQKFDI